MAAVKRFVAASAAETRAAAREFGGQLAPGTVLALVGELGAGKTTFVQGLAEGLDVLHPEDVVSPTYALMHVYDARCPLVHMDLYRVDDVAMLAALGLEEQLTRTDAIVVVEWGDKHPGWFPDRTVWVTLRDEGSDRRTIEVRTP